jgi:hypothetical protein
VVISYGGGVSQVTTVDTLVTYTVSAGAVTVCGGKVTTSGGEVTV